MRRLGIFLSIAALLTATSAPRADESPATETKLRLYAFFATWCVPCRVELPHIQRLAESYRERGLEVVLVSEDAPSTAANIPAFLARHNVTLEWILDDESQLLSRYNQSANVPFTALVRADGSLAYAHPGYEAGDEKLLEEAITTHLGAPAEARGGLEFRASSQSLAVYRQSRFDPVPENDGLLWAGVERLEASAFVGDLSALVRVDGAIVDDELSGRDRDARLERARLRDTFGPLTLTAGDDYASIGHGVTLSLRKVDPLGLDTALRGGRARVKTPGVQITTLAGVTNPQNLDPLDLRIVSPRSDFIAAAEVEVPLGDVVVAPYVFYASAKEAGGGGEDADWMIGGVSGSLAAGPLRVAAEVAGGRRDGIAVMRETPLAAYGSAQLARGRHTFLIESKAYRDWAIGRPADGLLYHEPPTLEREDQEVPANDNALGGRARYTVTFAGTMSAFVNLLHYRYAGDGTSAVRGDNATHGYTGTSGDRGAISYSAQTGYRREQDGGGDFKLQLWHFDADIGRPISSLFGRTVAVTLKWNHIEEEKQVFNVLSFRRGLAVAGVSIAGIGVVSALYGYSTERKNDTAPTHYPGAEIAVQLPRGGTAKLFAGRLTGGRICVSGSCRDVPPFDGVRLDLVARF